MTMLHTVHFEGMLQGRVYANRMAGIMSFNWSFN